MIHLSQILIDGGLLTGMALLLLTPAMLINPRIFLQDYPPDIKTAAVPKTPTERKLSLVFGIPFLLALVLVPFFSTLSLKPETRSFIPLFVNAFGVNMVFNLVDWLVLDWLLICTITPDFMVIPGTKGMAGYKNYAFHFRGFIIGTIFSAVFGLVIAVIVFLLK